ncbi:dynein axonemal intermediate chain 7 [Heteronotia binoei]|uniref:dynein axonemal intermediate chain 7 n=1 Tax=Heteronotia binoei TaxID=13085 RepID=UPI00292D73E2|nr:dynein axonemal intermediate chain 7 [Heteronotia binoei]
MSAGSRGKKKPSKAERLRLQREEEERRLFEEMEARLRAEQEEAERIERERIEREKTECLEAKDLERRGLEVAELSILEENFLVASQWKADCRASAKWSHYMACDGSPDATDPREINTYMSLWREDKNNDIQIVMEKGKRVLELIRKLQFSILDAPYEELTPEDVAQYQDTIQKLQALLHWKYDQATEQLLKQASSYAESESGNMEAVIKDANVTLCVWANLKKNPRIRAQTFRDEDRNPTNGFELPKPLTICDIAVRIFHTHYDHLSPLESFPREPPKLDFLTRFPPLAGPSVVKEEADDSKMAEDMVTEVKYGPSTLSVKLHTSTVSFKDIKPMVVDDIPADVYARRSTIVHSVSRAQLSALCFPEMEDEPPPEEDNIVDLHQFMPVGGVYHFDALKLPPQAKHVKGWTMVEVLDTGLETYPYSAMCEETEDTSLFVVGLTVNLLDSVIFFEEPLVGRWDPKGKYWRTDGIGDVSYNMKEKEVSFKMNGFSTITLMQDAHLNMPYQSWELRPNGADQAILVVLTTFAEVQIQVKQNQCMLISVNTMEETELLSDLRGEWMPPLALTVALRRAGMNIFPAEHSSKYVSLNKKSLDAELTCYQQMALVTSAFAFGWSKWNWKCGEDQVVFKACECSEQEVPENWALYMFNGQRAQKLRLTESSDTFSKAIADESEFHSTLFHLLKDTASEAALDRVQRAHYLFIDCVYQLLTATRLLSYA